MQWKTIMVHADPSAHAPGRIALAARLAKEFGAHLVGVATTNISRHVCPSYSGGPGSIICGYLDPVYAAANRCLDQFEAAVRGAGVPSWERHLTSDLPDEGLARQAEYCDLAVMSQNDPDESTSMVIANLPEYVVLNCARPVLIVPIAGNPGRPLRNILVAWNGSNEAASALTSALPLLQRAERVTVAMFDPPRQDSPAGVHPAADLSAYLGRHAVKAEVLVSHAGEDAGAAMLAMAAQSSADLLVMGCYGHTRLRELLLGGATRTVLQAATLPVMMAH